MLALAAMTNGSGSVIELAADGVALRFSKLADRYAHCFVVEIGTTKVSILRAYLQDPNAPWPTDPAIQQLVVEPIGPPEHPDVVLGVGMSGHGHWSLAAQWVELPEPGRSAIQLDYACKQRPPVAFLGSTYQVANQGDLEIFQLERVEVQDRHWTGWFVLAGSPTRYKLCVEVIEGQLDWQAETQRIQVRPEGSLEKPSTLRWCYRIAWLSCHE